MLSPRNAKKARSGLDSDRTSRVLGNGCGLPLDVERVNLTGLYLPLSALALVRLGAPGIAPQDQPRVQIRMSGGRNHRRLMPG